MPELAAVQYQTTSRFCSQDVAGKAETGHSCGGPVARRPSKATGCQREKRAMKDLIKQYLEQGISRRTLMRGLGAAGLAGGVAQSIIKSLEITPAMAQDAAAAGKIRDFHGNGGMLYVQQLK